VIKFWSSFRSRHVSHFIKIITSETTNPVFLKTTSARPEVKAWVPSRDHFSQPQGQSRSASRRSFQFKSFHPDENFGKNTLRVGSPDAYNTGPLRSLPLSLLDTAQWWDSVLCSQSHCQITPPFLTLSCFQSSAGHCGWRQIFLHVNHNNKVQWSEQLQENHNMQIMWL